MLGAVRAIRAEVGEALADIPGGYYRQEDSNGDAVVPSWWLHADSDAALGLNRAEVVSLDIWHNSLGDLEAAITAVSFLWMWREYLVAGFPGATYAAESKAIQHEEGGVLHATITLMAVGWDSDVLARTEG